MFQSFFPSPKLFLWSAIGWFLVTLAIWYSGAQGLTQFSLLQTSVELAEGERAPFLTPETVLLYQYIVLAAVLFCIAWFFIDRNRWYGWSVCGSALILLVTYFQVQISVWMNTWYGEFFDMIQQALEEAGTVTTDQYYGELLTVGYIIVPNVLISVMMLYFTSHYVFRWRTAMNDFYMSHWERLRDIEGASQRVQEDTMRFAGIVEGLGSAFIGSIMTLIAFLPLLYGLSQQITELPLLGTVNGSLVYLAILSAAGGTVLLALVGWRLPGLEFNNQKVEAAYRKELVYGEDDPTRADPKSVAELFGDVRKNYFKLYFNYMYFNVFRYGYNFTAQFIPFIALGPTIVGAGITLGVFQQVLNAFNRVENSFQFLANSWTTIVELLSIRKRLRAFEKRITDDVKIDPAEPALQM